MTRASQIENFIPHRTAITTEDIRASLADLDPTDSMFGLSVALPYTRRDDGTVDTIEIGPWSRPGNDWIVYMGRDYAGRGNANITAKVAHCPGHMVVLIVRALYAHLTAVGPQEQADTVEGDILYALGLGARMPVEDRSGVTESEAQQ